MTTALERVEASLAAHYVGEHDPMGQDVLAVCAELRTLRVALAHYADPATWVRTESEEGEFYVYRYAGKDTHAGVLPKPGAIARAALGTEGVR